MNTTPRSGRELRRRMLRRAVLRRIGSAPLAGLDGGAAPEPAVPPAAPESVVERKPVAGKPAKAQQQDTAKLLH